MGCAAQEVAYGAGTWIFCPALVLGATCAKCLTHTRLLSSLFSSSNPTSPLNYDSAIHFVPSSTQKLILCISNAHLVGTLFPMVTIIRPGARTKAISHTPDAGTHKFPKVALPGHNGQTRSQRLALRPFSRLPLTLVHSHVDAEVPIPIAGPVPTLAVLKLRIVKVYA